MKEVKRYICEACGKEYRNKKSCEAHEKTHYKLDCKEIEEIKEKNTPKNPRLEGDGYAPDGSFVWDTWFCPNCGSAYEVDCEKYNYCPDCGQKIDWEESEVL